MHKAAGTPTVFSRAAGDLEHEPREMMMYARSLFLTSLLLGLINNNSYAQINNRTDSFETLASQDARHQAEHMADMARADTFDASVPNTQNSPAATVTVHELSHEVPRKARKEYERAAKERRKGNNKGSIEHLKKAVAIDPEFWAAANDLGADYLDRNDLNHAIEEFNRGISIDPHNPLTYANLAVAYLRETRNKDAERAARQELKMDPIDPRGHLILGIALTFQSKFTPEAVQNLKRALPQYPQAHLPLAAVLAANGATDEARNELHQYVASGPRGGVDLANSWLRVLDRAAQDGTPVQVRVSTTE